MKKITAASVLVLTMSALGGVVNAQPLTGDPASGQSIFEHHCGACHSLTANRVGPNLSGVYGRKAGTAPNFHYSDAVKLSGVTWDAASINKWLTNPRDFIPGQRMNFSISDPQKRADVIAYLKAESTPGQ
jgi:cytochrome c